jgi:hypothetical protein
MQNPTQALKSVKDPGNTFDLNCKWERTVPYFGNFSWDIIRVPPNPNIKLIFNSLLWAGSAEPHPGT